LRRSSAENHRCWKQTIGANPKGFAPILFLPQYSERYSVQRRMMSVALMPPKPKEFDRATSKLWAMAWLGT
jgi:hypothetical protein